MYHLTFGSDGVSISTVATERAIPACLPNTKQTQAHSAKRPPIRDYQKDAVLSPAYYFQFLLEKVNLMSIIGN